MKKHQLASQLFGGLSGPSRAPRSKQHRKAPTTSYTASSGSSLKPASPRVPKTASSSAAAVKKPKEPQVDLLLDLQDIDFSSPAQEPSGSVGGAMGVTMATTSTTSGGGGLLANMEIRETSDDAKVTTSAPTSARYAVHVS